MDFEIPREIQDKLRELDDFIEQEIAPLEAENIQFFDHRREHARTDWENGGRPRPEWEALLAEMQRDRAVGAERRRVECAGRHRRVGAERGDVHLVDAADWVGQPDTARGKSLRGLLRAASRTVRARGPLRMEPPEPFPRFSSVVATSRPLATERTSI